MRTVRLGVFTVGADGGHRCGSPAITRVLILYRLVAAKAAVAVPGDDAAARERPSHGVPAPV
jgi:hypothetical protein